MYNFINVCKQKYFVTVLSDFYEVPLVKQYILQILYFCIFNQYLTYFGEIPKIVMDKIYTPIQINKHWNLNDNLQDTLLFSSNFNIKYFFI